MTVVVDANVMIAYALRDELLHTEARRALERWTTRSEPLVSPALYRAEIAAVMRKAVFQNRVSHELGRQYLIDVLSFPVAIYDDDDLLTQAYELAGEFSMPRAFDTQYVALAQRFGCIMWTCDERLVNTVSSALPNIRWLGDFS